MSIWIKTFWAYSKPNALATCNVELQGCLQEWNDVIPAGVSYKEMSVTAVLQHPGCLHIAKYRWCSLGNHPSKGGPCLLVPEATMSTCSYFRRTFKIIPVHIASCHVLTPRSYCTPCIFHKWYVQGNIPSIIFTKLPCTIVAAWCLWKSTPTPLYNRIRDVVYIQECHWKLLTETTATEETSRWTRYSTHQQNVTPFCKATCIVTYPPLLIVP